MRRYIAVLTITCLFLIGAAEGEKKLQIPENLQALESMRELCESGNGDACAYYGRGFSDGKVVEKDLKKTRAFYEKSCAMNSGLGCELVGIYWQHGLGSKKDIQKASVFYEKSCDLLKGSGCTNFAMLKSNGIGVEKDHVEAARLFERGCELGSPESCRISKRYKLTEPLLVLSCMLLFTLSTCVMWYLRKPRGWGRKDPLLILLGLGVASFGLRFLLDLHHVQWLTYLTIGMGTLLPFPLKKYLSKNL
ncbi:MAG: sel1 repeat family protein [Deltaproteobacteria bacterium]|nr:sel1 repeat family protein [Deltaproteobacteria bacterium]